MIDDGTCNGGSWFLIHTNPKQEQRTISNLRAWKIDTVAPQVRDSGYNQFTGERYDIIKPLFARYVFARFHIELSLHKVRFTRGVHELVSFGDGPVKVDDTIIDLIRERMDKDGFVKIGSDPKPGDVVVVREGALKDFTGVFERETKDSDRVVVLLNTISYQARLQIDRRMLHAFSQSGCSA